MKVLRRPKLTFLMATLALVAVIALPLTVSASSLYSQHTASASASSHAHIDCSRADSLCPDVVNSDDVFGHYVGHDEPANLFYSNVLGSGNRMRYALTLPKDPSPSLAGEPGVAYNFQLHPAFWFGMVMCDTQSWPEQLSTCTPDSDSNIVDPAISPDHAGAAFMEMQFYPPGWAPIQLDDDEGISCDATKWCAALNIDSLSVDPVNGTQLNPTCAAKTGLEYVNFAFITKNGVTQPNSPPNPVQSTINTFTPNPSVDLFMNSGDKLVLTMHDTAHGLQVVINDLTTGQSGSMTASAANGFGQVQYAPTGTSCVNLPYDFHPMYSTSSEKTWATWTAHTYNVAFSDEIGHWDYCTAIDPTTGNCTGLEGIPGDQEPADADDTFCFPASVSLRIPLSGCTGENDPGFDGTSYQPDWPDGNTKLHPTPIQFSSPLTGAGYNVQYNRMAFEADLPAIEFPTCNIFTGTGCTLIPETDDGQPAVFYPFYSIRNVGGPCVWQFGNHIPGSKNDFGQNSQYGQLLAPTYPAGPGGAPFTIYEDFRQILSKNPCPA